MSAPLPIQDVDVRRQRDSARRIECAITGFLIAFLMFIAGYLAAALADGRFERQPVRTGVIDVMAERHQLAAAEPRP